MCCSGPAATWFLFLLQLRLIWSGCCSFICLVPSLFLRKSAKGESDEPRSVPIERQECPGDGFAQRAGRCHCRGLGKGRRQRGLPWARSESWLRLRRNCCCWPQDVLLFR